jgi:DNA polymerase III subunit chi
VWRPYYSRKYIIGEIMVEVNFYHLTSSTLEKAMPRLLEKVYLAGKRAIVIANDEAKAEEYNTLLWTFSTNIFLPHGSKRDDFSHDQPIYITTSNENPNNASVVLITNGTIPANIDKFDKCLDMFDGNNESKLAEARKRWKDYQEMGAKTTYWQQDAKGNWTQSA